MRTVSAALSLFAAFLLVSPAAAGETRVSGKKTYSEDLVVGYGDTLKVMPGASLSFMPGVGVRVEGTLDAAGSAEKPVRFHGADGRWVGIRATTGAEVRLAHAEVKGAVEAVRLSGGKLVVRDVVISGCQKGIRLEMLSEAVIDRLKAEGTEKDALCVRQDSRATVRDSAFKGPGGVGVRTVGKCSATVSGSTFEGLDTGVASSYPGSSPEVSDCVFSGNRYGAYAEYPEAGPVMTRCRFEKGEYGVYAKKLSSPSLDGCTVTSCEYGLYVSEGASPTVKGCRITANRHGVYVTFSSYPRVSGSDLSGNTRYAVYLDEQSYDWVKSSGDDVRRQNMGMRAAAGTGGSAARERGQSSSRYVNPRGGFVDFTGNYWGREATAQMDRNRDLGDVGAIYDYFDLNTDVYEGKRWVRDKVDYSAYLRKSPVD